MIPNSMALALKNAGLVWKANIHDFFCIPDRGLDDRIFVISDLLASLDILRGWPVVTFQGGAEWALDYILTTEVAWVPTENQLRREIENIIQLRQDPRLHLGWHGDQHRCSIGYAGETHHFSAPTAEESYAQALLYLLEDRPEAP